LQFYSHKKKGFTLRSIQEVGRYEKYGLLPQHKSKAKGKRKKEKNAEKEVKVRSF